MSETLAEETSGESTTETTYRTSASSTQETPLTSSVPGSPSPASLGDTPAALGTWASTGSASSRDLSLSPDFSDDTDFPTAGDFPTGTDFPTAGDFPTGTDFPTAGDFPTTGDFPPAGSASSVSPAESAASAGRPGGQDPTTAAVVKGRIKVADEVVEKIAALATLEVSGVADLGGDLARAYESVRGRIGIGSRRANQGVSAQIQDRQVSIDITVVVEYGHVVMEVAAEVKNNVARTVSRMMGLRVTEVNVTVDDVRLPGEAPPPTPPGEDQSSSGR